MSADQDHIDRHKRHLLLKEIGGAGVQKLTEASVSIIGAGALGGPCALYLAAAGVGEIELWDDDRVDGSNLQRQIQFDAADIGALKVDRLAQRLSRQNPAIRVSQQAKRFTTGEAPQGRILIDASDNFETRFTLNVLAHTTKRAMVHGAAAGWQGQVSTFLSGLDPSKPCYQCWIPETPPNPEACDEVGVVGAVTGMVGATMALEVVKLVTGAGDTLAGYIQITDALAGRSRTLKLRKDSSCAAC